jgi:hypothetical protein
MQNKNFTFFFKIKMQCWNVGNVGNVGIAA